MTRLGNDNYSRPEKTFQEKLSTDEIKEKLKDYKKIDDISKVPLKSHVRYFSLVDDGNKMKKLFRMGGVLENKDNCDKYVVLSNGKASWSVNCQKSVFFKKMTSAEIHDKYNEEIKSLKKVIKSLKEK